MIALLTCHHRHIFQLTSILLFTSLARHSMNTALINDDNSDDCWTFVMTVRFTMLDNAGHVTTYNETLQLRHFQIMIIRKKYSHKNPTFGDSSDHPDQSRQYCPPPIIHHSSRQSPAALEFTKSTLPALCSSGEPLF